MRTEKATPPRSERPLLDESHRGLEHISVLVVDDDEDAREILAEILRRHGYSVATACDGQEALELLEKVRPDVIFVDLLMPRLDGARFREVQRRHRDWLTIPTIVMTGTNEEPQLDLAIEQTLRKPVRAADLLAIVQRHCEPQA